MNYFCHAKAFLDQPYFMAGTAMPDWIRVIDKRLRVRSKAARSFLEEHGDGCPPTTRALCLGIVQHHTDDDWFHNTQTFLALNAQFTGELRAQFGDDASMRAGFVGHISIELLLDAALIERSPKDLANYYRVLEGLDLSQLESALSTIVGRPMRQVTRLIRRFTVERFLYDYLDDVRLLRRLNQVMKRVGLPSLPESLAGWLAEARQAVDARVVELLDNPREFTP